MREVRKDGKQTTYRQKRWRIGAILVPAVLMSMAAGGYALMGPDEVVAAGLGCFETADFEGNVAVFDTTGQDPVEKCKQEWDAGNLGYESPAPEMVACVNEEGAVYVLPSDDAGVCSQMALQQLPDDYADAAKRFAAMRDDAVASIRDAARESDMCLTPEQSRRTVDGVLAQHDLGNWSSEVLSGDGYEGRDCANHLGFDDEAKKVLIIPSDATL